MPRPQQNSLSTKLPATQQQGLASVVDGVYDH